jgi:CRISPR system Cascade subunit CasD
MTDYLLLKLAGPMQFWGEPTFEGTRPTAPFPTRSGMLGLLAACLGIRRNEREALQNLADSVRFAVRCDQQRDDGSSNNVVKLTDYHTVQDARESYTGLKSHSTIQTWREYLCDAAFTVALWQNAAGSVSLADLARAVQKPVFTPYLGRRSCPLSEPLYVAEIDAVNPAEAMQKAKPCPGVIYSEQSISKDDRRYRVRDEPIVHMPRQFASREWFVYSGESPCT